MLSNLKRDIPRLLSLAGPLLVGQLAVIAFGVMDTAMVARYSTDDLAALAMAGSIFISIYVGLTGVISALAPIAGQLFGARKFKVIAALAWLAVALRAGTYGASDEILIISNLYGNIFLLGGLLVAFIAVVKKR